MRTQIANLQVLRAIAALMVVFHHVQPFLKGNYGAGLENDFGAFGAYGVDIFFVISGFIMFYTNSRLDKRPDRFILNRAIRIVPLYWLATFFLLPFYFLGFKPNGLSYLDTTLFVESLFFIPGMFPGDRQGLALSVGWTLMYELFFYVAFSATFFQRSLVRSLGILSLFFGTLVLSGYIVHSSSYFVLFLQNRIIFEFLYGGALAILVLRFGDKPLLRSTRLASALIVIGLLVPLAVSFQVSGITSEKDGIRFFLYGVPALSLVAGAVILENAGLRAKAPGLLLLGGASYALYLFHPTLLHGTVKIVATVMPIGGQWGAAIATLAAIAVAMAVAVAVHLLIERHIVNLGHRLTALRSRPVPRPA